MELTERQTDSLTELINIGYGRTAGALSELTGYRITLEVPQVSMHAIQRIGAMLEEVVAGEVASVNQAFSGPISGTALLLLNQEAAVMLSRLFAEENAPMRGFDANAREVITEVGNILLNACLGVFGNLLQVPVAFAVPSLHVEKIEHLLDSIAHTTEDSVQYGLMVHTRFHLRASDVSGYLVMILGISSLDRLLGELQRWEERQVQ